jgi:hypothetical protein
MIIRCAGLSVVLFAVFFQAANILAFDTKSEVRNAAQRAFDLLKAGRYSDIYESLPSSSRGRISRERFVGAMERAQSMYRLDRIEIGAVHVSGDVAVADTVIYGSVLKPVESEGKIVAQQYMLRENGGWRVATGDKAASDLLLKRNPDLAKRFPFRRPKIYVKRDSRWIDISNLLSRRPRV